MLDELRESHREITVEREPRCLRNELPSVAGVTPPGPAHYEGPAVQVQRVRMADLTAATFWRRFYRAGLPVVIEGGLSTAWLKRQAAEVGECCRAVQAERVAKHGESCRGCEPHGAALEQHRVLRDILCPPKTHNFRFRPLPSYFPLQTAIGTSRKKCSSAATSAAAARR